MGIGLAVIGGRIVDEIEIDARAIGRRLQVFERDFLDVHIDLRGGAVGKEFANNVVLAVGVEDSVGELAVEKIKRLREIVLDGEAIAPVVEIGELRKEILGLGVLRLVFEIVVVNGLGPAQVVDADDQRAEILEGANGPQIDQCKHDGDERKQHKGTFEVGIGHHRVTAGFKVEALGVVKARIAVNDISFAADTTPAAGASSNTAEEPPAVPLKMWFVSEGTLSRT